MKLCLTSPLDLLTTPVRVSESRVSAPRARVFVAAFPRATNAYFVTASKLDGRATVPFRYRVRAHVAANASS